jgi:hypothetical protein
VSSSSHYEVTRTGKQEGSPGRNGRACYVATALRNGVDQPVIAQHADRPPCRGARNFELFDDFALGWYPGVWRVLAGFDPPPQDVRYLPVGRNRGKRINPVFSHIDNASCIELTSYVGRRADTS